MVHLVEQGSLSHYFLILNESVQKSNLFDFMNLILWIKLLEKGYNKFLAII